MSILEEYRNSNEKTEELFNQLKKVHKSEPITINDNIVENSSICFVFSCPGQVEMLHNKVCFGQTGKNLDILLEKLHDLCCVRFQHTDRYQYNIINATNIVHYKALDGKTEASKEEINTLANKERISNELRKIKNLTHVIFFGEKAKQVADILENCKLTTVSSPHLGLQSLNKIKIDKNKFTTPQERNKERLQIIANKILEQFYGNCF